MDPISPRPNVLIVENDAMVRAMLLTLLEAEPYAVTACSNPLDALEELSRRNFALIISDYLMPDMTGLDFFVECRSRQPKASRILLTASLETPAAVAAVTRRDICRIITKPWVTADLLAAIRQAVEHHCRL